MKKYSLRSLFTISLLVISSLTSCGKYDESKCNNNHPEGCNYILQKEFNGQHELRRFAVKTSTTEHSSWSAGYFLFFGGASGSNSKNSVTYAKFCWLNNEEEYVLSWINCSKIRIRLDSTATTPKITFNLKEIESPRTFYWWDEIQERIDQFVNYITVVCREEDFPVNINLNDL